MPELENQYAIFQVSYYIQFVIH